MFDKIIAYSIKHKFIVGLLVLGLIIVGLYSLKNLPIDALPDITNNQVQVLTTSPSLATQEVELFITYPIELALKSIPRIVELRSVSRFGLSIVTVVFEEDVDIYWARSQITERLKAATDEIPNSYGVPELAPISTGLGEIYQYTVSAAVGYEEQFNVMELRSIQDWIISPQLIGTKGVAEVNTLGGKVKEYEVAVNPNKLQSMNVTMVEIFEALEKNNENTGGAYIDKKPYAYFIRSIGMVNSLEDVGKIVIKNNNGIPLLINSVAEVQFGNTMRYGATTKDGKGEVVNGMVMMLKGENSAEIIFLVKEKMEQIKKTLPEGVLVEPYLDRSKLVGKAISTVSTNLIEGALIVIFILVLLIGNWRAGLIVATVIPLALLFAVSMMRIFGVSGNLMSLGAIDFGLIVDGAVIIVESIVHRLGNNPSNQRLSVAEMDEQVYSAASKIRNSAAFGEIIILIVYLPILALVGIEGKMFKPMAQTVVFAILGAFILSLTYVPMMSALFLSKSISHKKTISDRIIAFFQTIYSPILKWAMKLRIIVLGLAVALFVFALITFNNLGGEFIPTLSEGDIATHVMIPPGSSLDQEIHSTTKAEQLLLANFPEVEQVVSKIGSAEVPTDPMPMEVADVMIILKDKKEWTSASSKKEMFEKMERVLNDLPGVTTEFTQPIQMRFNELMTGIRSDVGVKIFGENIERLVALGDQATAIVQTVEGVEDARAESVSGLPQITVKYNKDKLALYGLNVQDLNQIVSMGFAGGKAGVVYEGEKKFDLVVRLTEEFRNDIQNLRNLYVSLPSGNQIPLEQVANIDYERGPAQISRENGMRRIIVGFNVRNRDVVSVVEEIQRKFDAQLKMPTGYFINYAGQFENLKRANERLSVAVPIALALIFVLLFFTFKSIIQSLMIFTAIPLSAIGGVFALWLRDMPFSISAGVGFIALFGVAVLNGIVLISYFNQLKEEGMIDILERIKEGTKVRLRPVIMTASVASLGFLPMALSNSAGAEVQKPLATVVIGGLITATLLTLIVLPILYYYSEKVNRNNTKILKATLFLIIGTLSLSVSAQNSQSITLEQAIEIALVSNKMLEVQQLDIVKSKQLKDATYLVPKAEIDASFGQINNRSFDHSYSISQQFNPFLSKVKKTLGDAQVKSSEYFYEAKKQEIILLLRNTWNDISFHQSKLNLLIEQQSLWKQFTDYAAKKYQFGESNILEKTTAEVNYENINQKIKEAEAHKKIQVLKLQSLLNIKKELECVLEEFVSLEWSDLIDTLAMKNNPLLKAATQEINKIKAQKDMYKAEQKPEFKLGYFIQSFQGEQEVNAELVDYNVVPRFQGIMAGVNIPIFGKGYKAKGKVAETEVLIQQAKIEQLEIQLETELNSLLENYALQDTALPNATLIGTSAKKSYESGDIGYLEFIQALNTQYDIEQSYLESVKQYNESIYSLMFLLNF